MCKRWLLLWLWQGGCSPTSLKAQPCSPHPHSHPCRQTKHRQELVLGDSCSKGGWQPLQSHSLPGASGLSGLCRQQQEEKSGEHPRVLISLPSRDPSKSFSIIKQARPKNSTKIYYMWQDNLRGEQGTKCPLCPNLPPDDSVGTGRARGGCWLLGARVWRWVAMMPSKAAGLGEVLFPGRSSLAAFYVVVGFGRARQPQLGVPGCSEEGMHLGTPL